MVYDGVYQQSFADVTVNYGVIWGSDAVVFVKGGKWADVYGENREQPDLYVNLAEQIHKEYGCTVVVSDNPASGKHINALDYDMSFVKSLTAKQSDGKIVYVGYSAGANNGCWYGYLYDKIVAMLLINPVLSLNIHKTRECFKRFTGGLQAVFGAKDPSAGLVPMLPKRDNVKICILPKQGHKIADDVFVDTVKDFLNNLLK